ncbi:MAG: hypothetical protein F9K24_02350 [Leptonema illini]|uniref:Uncharacterized protein n=1 Tax=Leptonema illini TaxID=183 RepID=A0A833H465_9LEPT|nr:MAG: hypothetical protein F9K24_02350 [Leptonema illini]
MRFFKISMAGLTVALLLVGALLNLWSSQAFLFIITGTLSLTAVLLLDEPLRQLSAFLTRFTSTGNIILWTILSFAAAGLMQVLEKQIVLSAGVSLPLKMDFRPLSTINELTAVYELYGEAGRQMYFIINIVDMVFPVAFVLAIGGLFTLVADRANYSRRWNLLPLGFLVFDVIENSMQMLFIRQWPDVSATLALGCGVITFYKLVFFFVAFGGFIAGLIYLNLKGRTAQMA